MAFGHGQSRRLAARVPRSATLLCFALVCSWTAAAAGQADTLGRCIGQALHAARDAGARPLRKRERGFLLTRDTAQFTYDLPAAGCAGFLAVARRHGQDLQLRAYDEQGRALAQDSTTNAHPYIQVCTSQAAPLHVSVRMADGDGEFVLASIWDAPPVLVGLQEAMSACVHAGLPRPAPAEIGPAPLGAPIGHTLSRMRSGLGHRGYAPQGPMLSGVLPPLGREVRRVRLQAGQCYALVAVGDVSVGDIDLRVFSPGAHPRLLASDTTRRREAVSKLCPAESGEHLLEVRMYDGGGPYAIQPLQLETPRGTLPAGLTPRTRLGFSELTAHLRRRDMFVADHVWTLLPPRDSQPTPFQVQGGRCYAFGALGEPDAGPVELGLTDLEGNLIGTDSGLSDAPLVYHCAQRDRTLLAHPRMREARRAEAVLVVVARDGDPPEFALR